MERIFTFSELKKIERNALENPDYIGGVTIDGNSTEKSIKTISKVNNLIIVEGNEYTGFKHLNERHSYFSQNNYWITDNSEISKLDKPSKFHPKMMPIIDFVKIADSIFKPENKNITKNSRPNIFDKYTGTYIFSDNQSEKYHLIVYKDTKIVHTLFPNSKKNNRKTKMKYGRGIVTTTLKIPGNINDLLVPYENDKGIMVYSILLRKYYNEKIERLIIQKHNNNGKTIGFLLLGEREFNDFERFDREQMNSFQNGNLSEYEKYIIQIENGQIVN